MDYKIRFATPDDHDAIYALKAESVRPYVNRIWGWDEDYQRKDFDSDFSHLEQFNVIEVDGKFVGFIQYYFEYPYFEVVEIHLLPEYCGKGIGSDILRYLQKVCIAQDRKIRIGCFKENHRAKVLYQKLGFTQTDETDTHYILEYPKYITENNRVAFVQYTHEDDGDMLACWQDHDTQKGYNYAFNGTLDDLSYIDIEAFPFWVVAIDKPSGDKIGVLRLSCGDDQDLAIWIYPKYRGKGYGKEAFTLAVNHIFHSMNLQRIYAGCYCDNEASLKILQKSGFIRYPEGDQKEIDCFTGKPITQLSFVRTIDNGMNDINNALSKAWEMFDRGDFQGAEDLYLTCYEQISPSDHENINIALMGLLYTEAFLEKYEEARTYGNILLHEAHGEEEKHIAIHQIGMVERMAGNYEKAMDFFNEEARLISISFPDDQLRMSANLYEQGYIALKMKDYAQAEKLMLMSLECAIRAKDDMCMGCAFRGMGELMVAVGNRESAMGYFRKAIAAFTTADDLVAVEEIKLAIQQIEA